MNLSCDRLDHRAATEPRSRIVEFEPGKSTPGVPPYFLWPTKWQVSTTDLWGSYIKSFAFKVALRILRSFQFWSLRTNDSRPKG